MKKYILVIFIILVILLVPIKFKYKDGGTTEYKALLYKVIKWNTLEGRRGTDFYLFPNNIHSIDYYKEILPPKIFIEKYDKKIELNVGSYFWKENNKVVKVDFIHPIEFEYFDSIDLEAGEMLNIGTGTITKVEVYKDKELLKVDIKVEENIITIPKMEKDKYIFVLNIEFNNGESIYAFKANIVK